MKTKTVKIAYWVSTGIFSAMMAMSAFMYLTNPDIAKAFTHLGFPSYFRIELALFKFAGVITLLGPLPAGLKEWAYAGFFITLISAFTAHVSSGDGPDKYMAPVVCAGILICSYLSYRKIQSEQK